MNDEQMSTLPSSSRREEFTIKSQRKKRKKGKLMDMAQSPTVLQLNLKAVELLSQGQSELATTCLEDALWALSSFGYFEEEETSSSNYTHRYCTGVELFPVAATCKETSCSRAEARRSSFHLFRRAFIVMPLADEHYSKSKTPTPKDLFEIPAPHPSERDFLTWYCAVVFNLSMCHHLRALSSGKHEELKNVLFSYEAALKMLYEDEEEGELTSSRTLLELALLNNCCQIHSTLVNGEMTKYYLNGMLDCLSALDKARACGSTHVSFCHLSFFAENVRHNEHFLSRQSPAA